MPVITITMAQGQASAGQKAEMIRKLTEDSTAITGIPAAAFTILFHELPEENIGLAGLPLPEFRAAKQS